MNLLLLDEREREGELYRLSGARAAHVLSVLGKAPGDVVRAGLVGQGLGEARVLRVAGNELWLELGPLAPLALPRAELIVALPRPKGLSRLLQAAASFGVRGLWLVGGFRVDKSYFDSPRLAPERLREDLWLGCEQGVQCHLPRIEVIPRLRSFLDERLDAEPTLPGYLLHPHAPRPWRAEAARGPLRLAFGPEGGWTTGELRAFEARGFVPLTLGAAVLRTEVAVAAALGQLALLEALDSPP